MSNVICPRCKKAVSTKSLKSWKYKKFDVNRYECQQCNSKFNLYQSPTRSYTIPKLK